MLTKSVLQKRKISSSDASGSDFILKKAATATGTLEEIQQSCKEEIYEPKNTTQKSALQCIGNTYFFIYHCWFL
jgi:hypothetical protein